uniref:Uncharacterized protein n=1 Tax=Arundo donax TaxID=35708 RepID=A0A0A9H942_ARUDO
MNYTLVSYSPLATLTSSNEVAEFRSSEQMYSSYTLKKIDTIHFSS